MSEQETTPEGGNVPMVSSQQAALSTDGISFDYLPTSEIEVMSKEDAQRFLNKRDAQWTADPRGNPYANKNHAQFDDATAERTALFQVIHRDEKSLEETINSEWQGVLADQQEDRNVDVERHWLELQELGYGEGKPCPVDPSPRTARLIKMQWCFYKGDIPGTTALIKESFKDFNASAEETEIFDKFMNTAGTVLDETEASNVFHTIFTAISRHTREKDAIDSQRQETLLSVEPEEENPFENIEVSAAERMIKELTNTSGYVTGKMSKIESDGITKKLRQLYEIVNA